MKTWTVLLKREVKQTIIEEIEVEVEEAETEADAFELACNEADLHPEDIYSQVDDEDVEDWEIEAISCVDSEAPDEEFDWSVSH